MMEQRYIRTTMVKLIDRMFTEKFVREFFIKTKLEEPCPIQRVKTLIVKI